MKLRSTIQLLAVFACIVIFASCTKTNDLGKLIPNDAAMVVHINGQSLSSKLSWEEIKQNPLFVKLYGDSSTPAYVKNILDNPENSGINITSDLVFFARPDSITSIVAFEGSIKDAEKFKLFNLEIIKGASVTEKDGYHFISWNKICVGWNKEKFVYVSNSPNFSNRYGGYNTGMQGDEGKSIDLLASCKAIFDLPAKKSMSSNEKFTELVKNAGDIHFWINSEALIKNSGALKALNMVKLDKFYEGSITTATANFENGKIAVNFKSYSSKLLKDLMKKYSGGNINEDMLKRIPSKDVAAVFAVNFKPEVINELLKTLGFDGLANVGLSELGFTMDDFIKANKGDILFALTDFRQKNDTTITEGNGAHQVEFFNLKADYLFSASIADKDAFNKLIAAAKKMMGPQSVYSDEPSPFQLSYNTNGNYFAIGNSKENVDKYLAGGNNSFDFTAKFKDIPFGGYVNLQYIMKVLEPQMTKDSNARTAFDASLKMWDNIYITGGKYESGGMTSKMEINLVDKTSNSLKQLNQYLAILGKLAKEQMDRRNEVDMIMEEPKIPSVEK